ncbi:precorrin-2 dehydrogenase / sirohydrochlorin ferrochelatase [Paenibacillus uliginis N3/975]|uniref:precorrin-2 dehydrogenase n=1 Tax=Paenibacillus uliginis N3/975 TaxID=1313296 RepID=A0A1X7HM56_9BACL|nr:bifunctional precorrin-2 dehydrogenase/sirohydrochlorin ferrochelatase [Paenibacillus uliginis]SMF89266.1 precorrin-2 dehydrogenase / sirohydrochlorin ferrochelatase [Paenibacillus uliginis N3/975]
MVHYVPVMLNCEGQTCMIIGGGLVAERKVDMLLAAGALVHIISPLISESLLQLVDSDQIEWTSREYRDGDLKGAFLVHAATDVPTVNEAIAAEARQLGVMVNVASSGESGNFINPAVMKRGRLTVAVSTSGAGPLAAVDICSRLEKQLGDEFEPYLEFLYTMRCAVKKEVSSVSVRRKLLRKIHEIDILQDIRRGSYTPWSPEQIQQWISHNQEE